MHRLLHRKWPGHLRFLCRTLTCARCRRCAGRSILRGDVDSAGSLLTNEPWVRYHTKDARTLFSRQLSINSEGERHKMRRIFWCLKTGFLCVAVFVLLGGYTSRVGAQDMFESGDSGVCVTIACDQSTTDQCFCPREGLSCTGCYIKNGGERCGSCTSR